MMFCTRLNWLNAEPRKVNLFFCRLVLSSRGKFGFTLFNSTACHVCLFTCLREHHSLVLDSPSRMHGFEIGTDIGDLKHQQIIKVPE